jgi:DNA-binding NtrC family response regulator
MAAVLLMLVCVGTPGPLLACGDKFLVVGRGTRFQRATAPRQPAAILVFADPMSKLEMTLGNIPIESTLRKAGYQPTSVATADELNKALRQGKWDLVLVDVAQSQAVSDRVQGDAGPVVLPVVYNPTSAEWKQAKKQYPAVLKSPTKTQTLLDTIDEALSLKPKSPARPAGKTS